MAAIDHERWQEAQRAEYKFHRADPEKWDLQMAMYLDSYRQYFDHVGIEDDFGGKTIVEVGPGPISAFWAAQQLFPTWSRRYLGLVVEPLYYPRIDELLNKDSEYVWVKRPLEECWGLFNGDWVVIRKPLAPEENIAVDEVWCFNLLQHVKDPEICVNVMKMAKTVRFFEPINTEISDCHPHAFTIADFQRWFGVENVKYYDYNPKAKNFHTHCCAYGVWHNPAFL